MSYPLPASLQHLSIELSPYSQEAEQNARQWLRQLGLEADSHATHQLDIYMPGKYAGYMWPYAAPSDLYILSRLTAWFSRQDDLADEDLSRAPAALELAIRDVHTAISTSNAQPGGALAIGLRDILWCAAATMSPQWKQRTLEQYSSYLYGCMRAATHRLEGTQPPLKDYETVWRNAGGFQVCLEFTYFATHVHLPSHIYYSEVWQELCWLTLNLLKAVNDLASFHIMENPDEDVYNLLTHLRHHHGFSPDKAAAEVAGLVAGWAERFAVIQARLPDDLDRFNCDSDLTEKAVRCAEALRLQWHGNIGWHQAVPRYQVIRFQG